MVYISDFAKILGYLTCSVNGCDLSFLFLIHQVDHIFICILLCHSQLFY